MSLLTVSKVWQYLSFEHKQNSPPQTYALSRLKSTHVCGRLFFTSPAVNNYFHLQSAVQNSPYIQLQSDVSFVSCLYADALSKPPPFV